MREELIKLLQEDKEIYNILEGKIKKDIVNKLTISIEKENDWGSKGIRVKLLYNGEEIDDSYISININ